MSSTLKIASWNINSVRARTGIVERFLTEEAPDILCLQETKVRDSEFPHELFRRLGYRHNLICGQPMHHEAFISAQHQTQAPQDACRWRGDIYNGARSLPFQGQINGSPTHTRTGCGRRRHSGRLQFQSLSRCPSLRC